jgi:hypothetical protein
VIEYLLYITISAIWTLTTPVPWNAKCETQLVLRHEREPFKQLTLLSSPTASPDASVLRHSARSSADLDH